MNNPRRASRASIVACFALFAAISGCSRYAASHVARGDADFNANDYVNAIDEYEKAARVRPDDPHIIRQLGLANKALGHRMEAYTYLEKARQLDASDAVARTTLASMYLADARPQSTISEATAVLENSPENLEALNLLGSAHLAMQNPSKALETFRKISKIAPTNPRGPYLVGLGLLAQGKATQASNSFETALKLSPTFVDALGQIVKIDLAEKHSDAALARVKKQIATVGDSTQLYELLASVHVVRGENPLAQDALRKAATVGPHRVDPYLRLAELNLGRGKFADALAASDSALLIDPKNAYAFFVRGSAFQQQGDTARAKSSYTRALEVSPGYAPAANNLAELLSKAGDLERAVQLAQTAVRSAPGDPRIADTFGWILCQRGDFRRAVTILDGVAAALPAEPTVAYHLGMAKLKAGDVAGAREALTRAVSSPASFPDRDAAAKALAALK